VLLLLLLLLLLAVLVEVEVVAATTAAWSRPSICSNLPLPYAAAATADAPMNENLRQQCHLTI
jgi:hypothetical protein